MMMLSSNRLAMRSSLLRKKQGVRSLVAGVKVRACLRPEISISCMKPWSADYSDPVVRLSALWSCTVHCSQPPFTKVMACNRGEVSCSCCSILTLWAEMRL